MCDSLEAVLRAPLPAAESTKPARIVNRLARHPLHSCHPSLSHRDLNLSPPLLHP